MKNEKMTAEEYRKIAEKHSNLVKSQMKTFFITGLFTFTALIAVAALTAAWFASNTSVKSVNASVTAMSDGPYYLATEDAEQGVFDETLKVVKEIDRAEVEVIPKRVKEDHTVLTEAINYRPSKGKSVSMDVSETSNLSNSHDNRGIHPGASGVIRFYIIFNNTGFTEVEIDLNCEGYIEKIDHEKNTTYMLIENDTEVVKESGPTAGVKGEEINDLLEGHIMYFKDFDADTGYHHKLNMGQYILSAEDYGCEVFETNTAYEVTLYWVWPKIINNIITPTESDFGGVEEGYLFSKETDEYRDLMTYIKMNPTFFFYGYNESSIDANYDPANLTANQYNYFSNWYNDGDLLLGQYVRYYYLDISVGNE